MKYSQISQPLVSVIIPNYNHARYLDQRLQTILNQTYRNIEVIILDDCSTDNSLEVIKKYTSDARVVDVVVNEHNSGNTFLQWDKGIHLAKGELIWIAESDDYCKPNLLEELVRAFYMKKNTVLSYSTVFLVDDFGTIAYEVHEFENQYFSSCQYLRRYLTLANFVRNASCAIFSRTAALNVSSDYMKYIGAGDYLFWVEIVNQGRVAVVNKGLSYFRRHSGVVTDKRDADGTNFTAEKDILKVINSKVYISYLRKKLIYAYHCRRVLNTSYDSELIKKELHTLWGVDNHSGIISRIILKVSDIARFKYNIYI